MMMGICLHRFCLNRVGHFLLLVGPGYDELLWGVLFRIGVRCVLWCYFVVVSVAEICVYYGGVYVFDLCVVYGVGICVV